METPKVAVITRTKNRSVLLRRALDSVLSQTFTEWQHVIVNDGGDRGEIDALVDNVARRYGDRVKVIHHARSQGMGVAGNAGLRASASEYVVFHDDDDSWHPDFLRACVEHLEHETIFKSIAGVVTHSARVDEDVEGDAIVNPARSSFNGWMRSVSLYTLASGNPFPPISFVFRRRILDEVGTLREDLPLLGEWDFHLRVVRRYDVAVVPHELASMHFRRDSQLGDYSNASLAEPDKRAACDTLIRNELLRADLDSGRFGMGMLASMASGINEIESRISRNSAFIYFKDKVYNFAKKKKLL